MLSTIILSWNRAHLLRRTIESYLATTVGEATELFVVDNASSDGSVEYLKSLAAVEPRLRTIFLSDNHGGEAYNEVIPLTSGALVHLSENDQEFLPGWVAHVRAAFAAFSDLGQLSLHGCVPEDEEAWEPKPCHLRFSRGALLYEAHANVGTSSILRGELFRERAVRIRNLHQGSGSFKFPADGDLSNDVKALGFFVAWSDRYWVRNLGHFVTEFDTNADYYRANYESKPWLGVSGWQERIERQRAQPRATRASLAVPALIGMPEKTAQPVGVLPARLWSMVDGFTAELEVLDFLYALVRLTKPRYAIETGTWLGHTASAIGRALVDNGFGSLVTLDVNQEALAVAAKNIDAAGATQTTTPLLCESLAFTPQESIDFALFDSETHLREAEFRRFYDWLAPGALVVFHDTALHHAVVGDAVKRLVSDGLLAGIELPTPRGVFVGKRA